MRSNRRFRILSVLLLGLLLFSCPLFFACSKHRDNCAQHYAMEITLIDKAGTCAFEGKVQFQNKEIVMDCKKTNAACVCGAGQESGIYNVSIYNHSTGITDVGLIEATSAPPPQCFDRRAIEPFQRQSSSGGAAN